MTIVLFIDHIYLEYTKVQTVTLIPSYGTYLNDV